LSTCGPNQSRQPSLYPALPGREVIDMTREADEQSEDDDRHAGPSRQIGYSDGHGRQDIVPDMGRLTLGGETLAGQSRRRERNRRWDRDMGSDEEEIGHPSRARAKNKQKEPTIPVMEEQLALYRKLEGEAEIAGDERAQRDARKTAQHFERALRAKRAEQDAERERAKLPFVRRKSADYRHDQG